MMLPMINRKYTLLGFLLTICCMASAQEFRMQAPLGRVQVSGFYAIDITPALSAHIEADMRDLRIKDSASSFYTPYIVRKGQAVVHSGVFTELPVRRTTTDSIYTVTDIENTTGEPISDITLLIANTAVERLISVSGSNDDAKWYIIDNNLLCHRSYDNRMGSYAQAIHFPLSRYKYFRLRINNAQTDQLNIIKLGQYKEDGRPAEVAYMRNPRPWISQKDSSNLSFVMVHSDIPYLLDRVQLFVSGAKFFQRNAVISVRVGDSDATYYPSIGCSINSLGPAIVQMPGVKTRDICIEIDNKDNPPLVIDSVATFAEAQQVVVWLEPGKTYYLLAGDRKASTPQYDLSQFRDSIPAQLPMLLPGKFGPTPHSVAVVKAKDNNNWLWPTIIGAVLVLGLLTWRLLKDVKQNAA